VTGEKASQESQIPERVVLEPSVILIVNFVPWRLVGLTEI
jgi:hypothetical protein